MSLQIALSFSLGVHLLAFLSFGLVGDGMRQVRAYRWFVGAVAVWLLLALLAASGVAPGASRPAAGAVAHFLPVIFLLGGALPPAPGDRWLRPGMLAASSALLPFTISAWPWHRPVLELLYYGAVWTIVGVRVFQVMRRTAPVQRKRHWIVIMTVLVAGLVSIGLLVGMGAIAAIALLTALLQSVVLYATVRLSLYAAREDAGRTGVLVTDAAEHARRAIAGEIAAMVAHEVRNPLTGIRSLAQQLSDGSATEERRRRYSDLIVREVDRVERMVSALLGATTRRAVSSHTETELTRLFDDVALLVGERYRRAGVHLTVGPAAVRVAAPPEPLAQVLLNLLLNAVQQAPAVRQVQLSVQAARESPSDRVELHVRDDGHGIPPTERDVIFSPFHSGTGGSGLGLSVVRRLCDEWGWSIAVRETPGGGATFVLSLPGAGAVADAGAPSFPELGQLPLRQGAS